jgi:putative hemin transport protein
VTVEAIKQDPAAAKETPQGRAERIRAAVRCSPRKMTLQLARELDVPEVEVIRALPDGRGVELDAGRWEELIRGFEALGPVRVLVSSGAATLEAVGQFANFSRTGDFFNVQSESLDMHIRWRELAAVFAVEKPGHVDGAATHSFQFYDRSGAAGFKVFLSFGGPAAAEMVAKFKRLREQFNA